MTLRPSLVKPHVCTCAICFEPCRCSLLVSLNILTASLWTKELECTVSFLLNVVLSFLPSGAINIFITHPPVVYATDRSKVVVPVLFLFCVALLFILRGASCLKVFPCSLSLCFFILLALWSPRLGKRVLVCVLLVHLFVLSVFFSYSWCRGLAAVCDCGTPWTFLLIFLWRLILDLPRHLRLLIRSNRQKQNNSKSMLMLVPVLVCLNWHV